LACIPAADFLLDSDAAAHQNWAGDISMAVERERRAAVKGNEIDG
jgi:hypothetical protein